MQSKKTSSLVTSMKRTRLNSISTGVGPTVKRSNKTASYAFAKESVVPPQTYQSQIADVLMTKTKSGNEAVDVHYDLTSSTGKRYHVKMRYPLDSFYFEELCDALIEAGVSENADISAAIGVTETVELAYDNDSVFGSFVSRNPRVADDATTTASRSKIDSLLDEFEDDDDDEWADD